MLTCKGCHKEKDESEFYTRNGGSGIRGKCKECYGTKDKIAWRAYLRKRKYAKYGITLEQFQELLINQGGKCPICGVSQEKIANLFCVDHDHITKKVRGLLCRGCNMGLGYFKDDIEKLNRAINYLKQ